MDEKQLPPGEKRFIAKPRVRPRVTVWNVYDRQRASYPVHVPGFGRVTEDFTDEPNCQAEADRLEAFYQEEASDA